MKSKRKCTVEFKEHGLEITGPCAAGFAGLFESIYKSSKDLEAEISAYACLEPKTGSVERAVLGKIGTSTSTSLPYERVCPTNQRQVSIHSHPTSGEAKFSKTDAMTITHRMNEEMDDASCVVGEEETQCLIKALIPNRTPV